MNRMLNPNTFVPLNYFDLIPGVKRFCRKHDLKGTGAGGCLVLACAIKKVLGRGRLWGVRVFHPGDSKYLLQHVFLRTREGYWDSNGLRVTHLQIMESCGAGGGDGSRRKVDPLSKLPEWQINNIRYSEAAVNELALVIREHVGELLRYRKF